MVEIKKILEKQSVSFDDLLACFEQIKENGDVAVIKFDGERVEISIPFSFLFLKMRINQ